MTEVRFYHLTYQNQSQVLPVILTRMLSRGQKAVLKFSEQQSLEAMNEHLWTFDPDSFIPHGGKKDGHATEQPIYLTTEDENPNSADVLFLCSGAESAMHGGFDLCCEMLDGNDTQGVTAARERWKAYKEQGFEVTYWQQSESRGWEKKA